jgi:hypothetical protein
MYNATFRTGLIHRILVASNAIKTIDNEMINLIKLHYLLFELHSTRPKFDADRIDFIIYVFLLVYARNGRFIVTCVLYFRQSNQ